MNKIPITINNHDGDIVASLFGTSTPGANTITKSDVGVLLQFEDEKIRRGFVETEFIIQLAVSIPVGIVSSIVASYIYEKIKSHLSKGDTINIGESSIQVEDIDNIKNKLTEILEEIRNQKLDE